jgi:hypothetical protein
VDFLADFTPTVRRASQKNSSNKAGIVVGVVVGAAVLVLVALGLCMWRQKRRKLALEQQGIRYAIVTYHNSQSDIKLNQQERQCFCKLMLW